MTENDMNAMIRHAAGRTVPAEEGPADDEAQAKRPGDANAGVMPLPADPPDMNKLLRGAVSRARFGHDGTQPAPIRRP